LDREQLIQQVKNEYARLAQQESRDHRTDQYNNGLSPEAYYEQALEQAIREIEAGKHDDCGSGLKVIERIANRKTKARRIQDTIESTLHNMEAAEEMMAFEQDPKKIQELEEANRRRAQVIPQMIREMKEAKAKEELASNSPNVIGGGGGNGS